MVEIHGGESLSQNKESGTVCTSLFIFDDTCLSVCLSTCLSSIYLPMEYICALLLKNKFIKNVINFH